MEAGVKIDESQYILCKNGFESTLVIRTDPACYDVLLLNKPTRKKTEDGPPKKGSPPERTHTLLMMNSKIEFYHSSISGNRSWHSSSVNSRRTRGRSSRYSRTGSRHLTTTGGETVVTSSTSTESL